MSATIIACRALTNYTLVYRKDGVSLPELYLFTDIAPGLGLFANSTNYTTSSISPLKSINGKDAVEYLNSIAPQANFHDPDVGYNRLFLEWPRVAIKAEDLDGNSQSPFTKPKIYDGPITTFEFKNGSTKTIQNLAQIRSVYNFTGVTDGPSFFKKFCSGPLETTQPSSTPTEEEPTNPEQETPTATPQLLDKLPGYPKPVFLQSQYAVQGYYLDGSGYSDVAVLAIPNFGPEVAPGFNFTSGEAESQELLQNFFADARSKQKKRLIVDLRGNPGGKINLGFEVFKQLFPDLDPFGGSRYRANEAFGIMSSIFADAAENNTLKETDLELYNTIVDYAGPFNYQAIRNVNGSNFKTFDEYWGPYVNNGDNFTAIRRYNVSSQVPTTSSFCHALDIYARQQFSNPPNGYTLGANLNLTGYASEAPAPPQPFAAENIVILQDGICSSTCSIFSELMREQGHVHTIVVGGRPQTGPMQAIGGTKGAQVFNMDDIVGFSAKTLNFTEQLYGGSTREQVNKTAVGKLAATTQIYTRSSPLLPPDTPTGGTLNALDNLRMNDTQEIPLEFVYEAADCRLFNTLESIADVTKLWKLAVDAKWGDGKCVEGSTGDKTAISVADNVPFNNKNGTQSGNPPPQQFPGAASGLKTSGATMVVAALCVIVLLL